MKKFRVIFMGTPEFAVPCLAALYENCDVIGVVTQPDKPRGRGQKLVPSPVKAWAEAHGLPVWQPKKIKEEAFTAFLEEQKPDLMVVVAFGQILSQRILDIPPYGCINVHGSLLPRYRGAAPMQWCVIDGEKKTGVTTMFMDAGLDTGDMLLKAEFPIGPDTTLEEVHEPYLIQEGYLQRTAQGRVLTSKVDYFNYSLLAMTPATYARIVPNGDHCEACWEEQIPFFMHILFYNRE